jgi:hypothetical protein
MDSDQSGANPETESTMSHSSRLSFVARLVAEHEVQFAAEKNTSQFLYDFRQI